MLGSSGPQPPLDLLPDHSAAEAAEAAAAGEAVVRQTPRPRGAAGEGLARHAAVRDARHVRRHRRAADHRDAHAPPVGRALHHRRHAQLLPRPHARQRGVARLGGGEHDSIH